jgi:GxxExxY protein
MPKTPLPHEALTDVIIRAFFNVRTVLKIGFPEALYQRALAIELRHLGVSSEFEVPYVVRYRNEIVGQYRVDLLVEKLVIVEVKRAERLVQAHRDQVDGYLAASGYDVGLLVNFGPNAEVRRVDRRR